MLILLSSSKRKRYRDDILRCLAAPKGAQVQFRYSKEIVEDRIWNSPEQFEGKEGVVCSVDLDVVGQPCPLIPVRSVIVNKIYRHGTTLSLIFSIGSLSITENIDEFTKEINTKSGGQVPINDTIRNEAKGTVGRFFFDIVGGVGNLSSPNNLLNWEKIVGKLYSCQQGYKEEPIFWTIIGLFENRTLELALRADDFVPWKKTIDPNKDDTLFVYVFHPLKDRWSPKPTQLQLSSNFELSTTYPLDITIDSPYDLKIWRFQIKATDIGSNNRGWFKIGPVSGDSFEKGSGGQPDWEVDLPVILNFDWVNFAFSTAAIGVLLASPAATTIWLQQTLSAPTKIWASVASVVAGITASIIGRFGIKRNV